MSSKGLKILTTQELQLVKGADEFINESKGSKFYEIMQNKWLFMESLQNYIIERQQYCDEKIEFWKDKPELQQVWIGIKAELETLKRSCDL